MSCRSCRHHRGSFGGRAARSATSWRTSLRAEPVCLARLARSREVQIEWVGDAIAGGRWGGLRYLSLRRQASHRSRAIPRDGSVSAWPGATRDPVGTDCAHEVDPGIFVIPGDVDLTVGVDGARDTARVSGTVRVTPRGRPGGDLSSRFEDHPLPGSLIESGGAVEAPLLAVARRGLHGRRAE